MSIKNVSDTLKSNLATNPYVENRFYIDPRRIEYPPISGTETYYQHVSTDPVAGDYSLSQSTSVYMLPFVNPVTAPTTFEIMFKPMFAYDVATSQRFCLYRSSTADASYLSFYYEADGDRMYALYIAPGVIKSVGLGQVYTSNAQLQQWIRLTLVCTSAGMTIYSNGSNAVTTAVSTSEWNAMLGMQFFRPSNNTLGYINYILHINNFAATAAQVANGFYEVPNEQIYFSFQKCGIGRTRCDITNQVKSYSHEYSDGYKAATFSLSMMNLDGRFSADQYAPFMPESASYNGTVAQSYLANNKVGISCEQWSKQKLLPDANLQAYYSCDTLPDIPDDSAGTTYLQDAWDTTDGWGPNANGPITVSGGYLNVAANQQYAYRAIDYNGKHVRVRLTASTSGTYYIGYRTPAGTYYLAFKGRVFAAGESGLIDALIPETTSHIFIGNGTMALAIKTIYVGTGHYTSPAIDNSGNGRHLGIYGPVPCAGVSGKGLLFNGVSDYLSGDINQDTWTGAFSKSFWIQGKARSTLQAMYARTGTAAPHYGIACRLDASNRPQMYVSVDGTNVVYVTGAAGTECTADCLLTFRFVPSVGMYIYKNGALIASLTTGVPALAYWSASQLVRYGCLTTVGFFDGWMDELCIYSRALSADEVYNLYMMFSEHYDLTGDSRFEPMFYGTTEAGSFSRTTDTNGIPMITISADDQIKDIAMRNVRSSRHWESYYFSRATPSNNSLLHEYVWLASKKEMYNYLGNSGFENTTIGNSWVASGVGATWARSNTYALLGTYSGYLTGTSGLAITQAVTTDVSAGEVFTFQIYARGPAQDITLRIYEYTGATLNGASSSALPINALGWNNISMSYTAVNHASDRIVVSASIAISGVYFDMAMLTYGGVKTFYIENTNDGTAGVISSSLAMLGTYDQIGIDAEDVTYTHPWAVITKGESPWEMVKQLCDATICRYFHIFQGILRYRSYMASDHSASYLGVIPKVSSVSTIEQPVGANKITVEGVIINTEKSDGCVFSARYNTDLMDNSYSNTANTIPNTQSFTRWIAAGERWPDVADYPRGFELRYEEPSAIEEKMKVK